MTKVFLEKKIMTDFVPTYIHHRQKEEELKRRKQRLDFAFRNQPNSSTQVASDSITFNKKHRQSMADALEEVRKNKSTIPDGLHMRPENHKGFY